jgi:hypothetical protein
LASVRREATIQAPKVTDQWALFTSLVQGVIERLSTFGSGAFRTYGYSVTHQGGTIQYDTVEAARAGSEGTPERLDSIYVSFNEDAGEERRLEALGKQPTDTTLPEWDEYWKRYRAWAVDRTRSVTLIVYKHPGCWTFLVVEGENPNEVLGCMQNLTAMIKARTEALTAARRATGIRRTWHGVSQHQVWSKVLATLIAAGILAGVAAVWALVAK